jgi:hypothetical protein
VRSERFQGRAGENNGARVVSPGELGALARRHVVALTIIALLAAGVAYSFKRSPPTYQESTTLVFTAHAASRYNDSLVTTSGIMVKWTLGPQGQQKLRQAGVTSGFNVALVNLYDQEYPNYPYPFVTVSASAEDPAVAHRTFVLGTQVLVSELLARQVEQGVLPQNRITTYSVGDSGPVILQGSRIRSFAGLLLLTIVAAFLVLTFLDRRPIRPRRLLRVPRRGHHDSVGVRPVDHASTS